MTISANDAHEFPIYAGRYRVVFPVLDADGDPVTAISTPDSERSIDQGTFSDCTNEATEIATSSGIYYLDLTAAETTGKCIAVQVKSATSGMKTTVLTLYPKRMPIIRSGTAQAGAGSTITLDSGASAKDGAYVGMWIQCSNNSPSNVQGQTRKIISYVGSTKVATVEAAWGTNPSSATTFDILIPETVNINAWMGKETVDWNTAGVPGVDTLRVSGTAQTARDLGASVLLSAGTGTGQLDFTSGVVKANVTQYGGTNGTFASGRPEVNTSHIAGSAVSTASAQIGVNVVNAGGTAWGSGAITAASIATDAITAAKIAADAIGASELAADAVTEIQSGLATSATATSIKNQTDLIPGTQDGKTFAETILLMASVLLGKASGLDTTTAKFRSLGDTKDRVTATVDTNGNRSAVTLDAT